MSKTEKPSIRFHGFDDTWEQRKLGDNIAEYTEKTTINNQYPVLTSSRRGIFFQTDYYDGNQIASADNTGYNIVPYGYFTYRHMSDDEIFHFNINDITENGIVSTLYPVFTTDENLDSRYLQYQLNYGKEFAKYAVLQKQGGSRTYMYLNKLKELRLTIPNFVEEQKKISAYFMKLDNFITLHQRKFEKLTNVKKSMLEKMFPQNGSSYPKIRFKGFTDPWEQRKLSEITDKVTEKNAGLQYVETFTNSAEFGIISQRDFFDHDIAKLGSLDGYYIVKNEDFVYNPRISTSAPVGPINRNKLGRTGVMSPLYTVFRPHDIDTTYLEYFFKCGYWHSFMNFNGDSGARSDRFSIRDNVFFQMPIPIPDIDEQRKIGELLTCLDNLITLHQRECISFTGRADRLILTANKKRTTSSWEQRKVQGVADRFDNLRIPVAANLRVHGTTPYYGANGIQDYVEGFTHDGEFVLVAEDGANDLKNYPVKCVNGRIWVNNHAHVLQGKAGIADNSFLAFAISQSDIESLLVGGGRAKLNAETLMSIEFRLPCLQEQYRIGEYLTQLNHLITLHQRELEKLQNIKKSMLEKMFV